MELLNEISYAQNPDLYNLDLYRARPRILVIEDDVTLRPFLTGLINKIDPSIQVDWEFSVAAFLEHEKERPLPSWPKYDMVLTDIYMPDKATGIDVWKYFREHSPLTPVVLMSGLTQHEFFKSMQHEIYTPPYLEKPLSGAECRLMIEGILDRGLDR